MSEDFGDFGFVEEEEKKVSTDSPKSKPKRKASQRRNLDLYAKSPQQKMQEAAAEQDFQDALQAEKDRQEEGFGDGFDGGGGDGSPEPEGQQQFAIWGQPSKGGGGGGGNSLGVVIPPFVPRDKRNANAWEKGMITKRDSDKMILAGSHGDFLIRETKKGDRHVVCVNDQGGLYETYIRHVDGTFMFSSREFDTLSDIVKHMQRNPLYNRQGLPLYIDKPCKSL